MLVHSPSERHHAADRIDILLDVAGTAGADVRQHAADVDVGVVVVSGERVTRKIGVGIVELGGFQLLAALGDQTRDLAGGRDFLRRTWKPPSALGRLHLWR